MILLVIHAFMENNAGTLCLSADTNCSATISTKNQRKCCECLTVEPLLNLENIKKVSSSTPAPSF